MPIHRLKQNFTTGEVTRHLAIRTDFERYINACSVLQNAVVLTQGPVTRRPGTQFIFDLSLVEDIHPTDPQLRLVPFIFNETQRYVLIFYRTATYGKKILFATNDGLLVYTTSTYPTITPPHLPGSLVSVELESNFDIPNFDYAQSGDYLFIAQSKLSPRALKRHTHESWSYSKINFVNAPTEWTYDNGFPESVVLHQQRLLFAGSKSFRQTIWGSQAGDFYDFGPIDTQAVPADGFAFHLDSGTQNKIIWMHATRVLTIGTLANEWTITGTASSVLAASQVLAQRQTDLGSEKIKPFSIGATTLFVEKHGRSINEFTYNYTYDSYETSDVLVLAPHLTEHYSIVAWAYQAVPHRIIWCVRSDGSIIALTYQRPHKVIGWHRHNTSGQFKSIACIPGKTREDEVWVVVRRWIDNEYRFYLEKLYPYFSGEEASEGRFLDCCVEVLADPEIGPFDTIDDLYMFEGKTIDILADGVVHPSRTVVNGTITLQAKYSKVLLGFGYTTEIRPFVPDIKFESGTAIGRRGRITDIQVFLDKSLGMQIGLIDEDGNEVVETVPFRTPLHATGEAIPLFSGIKNLSFPEGYDWEIEYFIRQTQPLPLTVLGVVDKLEVES